MEEVLLLTLDEVLAIDGDQLERYGGRRSMGHASVVAGADDRPKLERRCRYSA